jgi:hypothetical protein
MVGQKQVRARRLSFASLAQVPVILGGASWLCNPTVIGRVSTTGAIPERK